MNYFFIKEGSYSLVVPIMSRVICSPTLVISILVLKKSLDIDISTIFNENI